METQLSRLPRRHVFHFTQVDISLRALQRRARAPHRPIPSSALCAATHACSAVQLSRFSRHHSPSVARRVLHLLRPALLCPSKLLASALNRKTGQRPRPATQLYAPACCVYCGSLLQLQGGAGLRGKCGECCRVKSPCGGSSGAPACQTIASLHTSSTLHPLRITLSTAPLRAAAKQ